MSANRGVRHRLARLTRYLYASRRFRLADASAHSVLRLERAQEGLGGFGVKWLYKLDRRRHRRAFWRRWDERLAERAR